jgi:hypothetical protein
MQAITSLWVFLIIKIKISNIAFWTADPGSKNIFNHGKKS